LTNNLSRRYTYEFSIIYERSPIFKNTKKICSFRDADRRDRLLNNVKIKYRRYFNDIWIRK